MEMRTLRRSLLCSRLFANSNPNRTDQCPLFLTATAEPVHYSPVEAYELHEFHRVSIRWGSSRERQALETRRRSQLAGKKKKKETGCLALLMKLIIPTVGVIERHTACYTVIITHVVLLASSPGLLCGLDNCSRLEEGRRVGVRLTLPGDATAGHGTETVPSRHKFTDSSLLAVNAVRQELLSRWYTHTYTHIIYAIYAIYRIAGTNQRRACYELGRQFVERQQPMLQPLRCSRL